MAPGSRIGDFGDPLDVPGVPLDFGSATDRLRTDTLGEAEARGRPAPSRSASTTPARPTLGDFIVVLDGVTANGEDAGHGQRRLQGQRAAARAQRPHPLRQARPAPAADAHGGQPAGRLPAAHHRPGPARLRVLHRRRRRRRRGRRGVPRPRLLRRRRSLPTRPWAFALLVAVDVGLRRRRPDRRPPVLDRRRAWWRFVVASVFLYDGLSLSWITLLAGIGGVLLAFLAGMPAMVRTRFATPTIGREWMIGEMGRRPSRPSTPTASCRCGAPRGGPTPTGPRRSPAGEPDAGGRHRRRHPRGRTGDRRGRGLPRASPASVDATALGGTAGG